MINQVSYHLKVDEDVARELEQEARLGHAKRNRIINEAIAMYLAAIDARRTAACLPSTVWPHPSFRPFIERYLTPKYK